MATELTDLPTHYRRIRHFLKKGVRVHITGNGDLQLKHHGLQLELNCSGDSYAYIAWEIEKLKGPYNV